MMRLSNDKVHDAVGNERSIRPQYKATIWSATLCFTIVGHTNGPVKTEKPIEGIRPT
jgi:hypothetical protein